MILVSFDVGDGRQKDFEEILEKLGFQKALGEGQNTDYLPESTMVRTSSANLAQLEHEISSRAVTSKIEIKRLVLFGGQPEGIAFLGTRLKSKED